VLAIRDGLTGLYHRRHLHEVLRSIAELLMENTRDTDSVPRRGGEEFVIVAPETDGQEGMDIADKLRTAVARFPFYGRDAMPGGRLTISVGVADLASDLTHDALVHRADQAVYRAKEDGRNKVCLAA
jgi:diguanylate cyclase (GGDEF)-like protein